MDEEEKRRVPLMPNLIRSVVAAGRPAEIDVAAAVRYPCTPASA